MATFNWGFANSADENEEEEPEFLFHSGSRDGLIFLVDCTEHMFDKDDEKESHFELCIKCAKTTLQNKIISSDKDFVGTVFFGTEKSKNAGDFKHIYVYQELGQPDAERILDLEKMTKTGWKTFGKDYGHSHSFNLSDALWACSDMFSKSSQKLNFKRIMLFTNDDEPHPDQAMKNQARARASDLNMTGVDLELMHLQKPNRAFDISKFYKDILFTDDDELTAVADPAEKLEELLTRVRCKDHKKRALRRIPFSLGEGLSMAVGVYNLIGRCQKPNPVKLSKKTNEQLKSHRKTYLKETSDVLLPQDIKMAQTYGGRMICFEKEELDEVKRFDTSGLSLLGFKPSEILKKYHHVKPSQFIYPDENSVSGSTCLFVALLKKCSERKVVAICKYVSMRGAPPRFVALFPQLEEIDGHRVQTSPPGFHVIFLPFADDFRKVKSEDNSRAKDEQINKAKELVKKLQFKFSSENFENPVLQQHWRNVEALALDAEAPEELVDYTMPNVDQVNKRAGKLIDEFKDLVYPDDYNPLAKKKRGQVGSDSASKRAKVEIAASEINLKKEAEEGRLGKLTVTVLKQLMKIENIRTTSTKKAELIEAINSHYGV